MPTTSKAHFHKALRPINRYNKRSLEESHDATHDVLQRTSLKELSAQVDADNRFLESHTTHQPATSAIPHLWLVLDQAGESSEPAFAQASQRSADGKTPVPHEPESPHTASLRCSSAGSVPTAQIPYMHGQHLLLSFPASHMCDLNSLLTSWMVDSRSQLHDPSALQITFQVVPTNESKSS